ncbi:MAG TPA: hypothetical protein VII13_14885 [Vicinamibacteria bacterium]|jgi:hypothetical protein
MATPTRERRRDPHRCKACGTAFEVTYFDDRRDARSELPPVLADVPCPRCGKTKSVTVPAGAERTLVIEPGGEVSETGGGG